MRDENQRMTNPMSASTIAMKATMSESRMTRARSLLATPSSMICRNRSGAATTSMASTTTSTRNTAIERQ